MTERDALMKVWEFRTSGCPQSRTFNAATAEAMRQLRGATGGMALSGWTRL